MKTNKALLFSGFLLVFLACTNHGDFAKTKELTEEEREKIRQENSISGLKKYKLIPKKSFGLLQYDTLIISIEKYYQTGKLNEETSFAYGNGQFSRKEIKTYFENGKIFKEYERTEFNAVLGQRVIKYNDKTFPISSTEILKEYNSKGQQIKSFSQFDNNHLFRGEYTWISDTCYDYKYFNPLGVVEEFHRTYLDIKGNTISEFDMNTMEKITENLFQYDSKDNITMSQYYSSYAQICSRQEYIYEEDVLIETRMYECIPSVSGKLNYEMKYRETKKYDNYKNVIEDITFERDGSHREKYVNEYKYDSYGNILEVLEINNGENFRRTINNFQEDGKLKSIEKYRFKKDETKTTIYDYYSNNLIKSKSHFINNSEQPEYILLYIYE